MEIITKEVDVNGIKFFALLEGKEVGRVFLYILRNDLHPEPFGFLEDLFVEEAHRRQGLATSLIKEAVRLAKEQGCYKLIGTSRFSREELHKFYEGAGFKKHGFEFRADFK